MVDFDEFSRILHNRVSFPFQRSPNEVPFIEIRVGRPQNFGYSVDILLLWETIDIISENHRFIPHFVAGMRHCTFPIGSQWVKFRYRRSVIVSVY